MSHAFSGAEIVCFATYYANLAIFTWRKVTLNVGCCRPLIEENARPSEHNSFEAGLKETDEGKTKDTNAIQDKSGTWKLK